MLFGAKCAPNPKTDSNEDSEEDNCLEKTRCWLCDPWMSSQLQVFLLPASRPTAWSGHMVQHHTGWDESCIVGLQKQSKSYQSTLICLCLCLSLTEHPSLCDFEPCDQIMQRAYFKLDWMTSHKQGLAAKYSFTMAASCIWWRQKCKLLGVTSFRNKVHLHNVQTWTAKKTVIREKATIRNNTMKILIMFSIDLSIMLLIWKYTKVQITVVTINV